MSGFKSKVDGDIIAKVENEAEALFRSKKMNCAQAALLALKNEFRPDLPDDIIDMAAGFGAGSSSGCICGAIVGATMAMGLVITNDRKRVAALTKELHKWFGAKYGAACCRMILAEKKGICASITANLAGKAAELLL